MKLLTRKHEETLTVLRKTAETLPDADIEEIVSFPRSSEVSEPCKPIRTSNSTMNLRKEPTSPKWRSAKKPISRFPIEREPWKQPGRVRVGEKPVSRTTKSPVKAASPFPKFQGGDYVYGRKGNAISRTAKEHQPRTSYGSSSVSPNEARRTLKSTQSSTRSQQLPKARRTLKSTQSSVKSPGLPDNKLELEKRSRPPTPPSDSNRSRRQPNKQQTEGGRRRARLSGQSNGNVISVVTSFERLGCDLVEKKSQDELLEAAPEYPSPDNATHTNESPSPVKHTLKVTTDEGCKTDVLSV